MVASMDPTYIWWLTCSPGAGLLVLSASKTEDKDNLWLVDPDLFPFQNTLMESHVSLQTTILFTPL